MIKQLGGVEKVQGYINDKGFKDTELNRQLLDQGALKKNKDNYTSVNDLGSYLTQLQNNQLVNKKYDNVMKDILEQQKNHDKLPKEFPQGTKVLNKTGEYDEYGVDTDAVLFEVDGKSFIIVGMIEADIKNRLSVMNDVGEVVYQEVATNYALEK